jgi:septum formation inhibitor-activating ATPase MinD
LVARSCGEAAVRVVVVDSDVFQALLASLVGCETRIVASLHNHWVVLDEAERRSGGVSGVKRAYRRRGMSRDVQM